MRKEAFLQNILDFLLKNKIGDESHFVITHQNHNITRFADSRVHQNTSIDETEIHLSIALGKRIATSTITGAQREVLENTLTQMKKTLKYAPQIQDFEGFADPEPVIETNTFYEKTYHYNETERASIVKKIVDTLKDISVSGIVSTGGSEILVGNTRGVHVYAIQSDAHITITGIKEGNTAWAEGHSRNIENIDPFLLSMRVKEKIEKSKEKIEIKKGEYPCILEFPAVATILEFMGYTGFSAKAYEEKRSFLINRMHKKLFSPLLTIYQDPFEEKSFNFPFDFEGTPSKKVILVNNGVPENLVYDTRTARKQGKKSTGNAFFGTPPFTFPIPFNTSIVPGEKTLEEIIKSTDYGIYITRFHYTNIVEPMEFVLTGMTRDGTFLIEDGKIKKAIKNLRFTDSFINVLSRVKEISKEIELIGDEGYGFRFPIGFFVPALKIESIRFTSETIF